MPQIEQLKSFVSGAGRLVAFTGAGISAESGIPTYRGEDGVWHKYDATKYANIDYFMKDSSYYWQYFRDVRYPGLKDARPNPAHEALADLERKGVLAAVITQNIDGLHQLAGSKRVLELHGNTRRISCLSCGETFTMEETFARLAEALPPPCPACGGTLRPEVVFFGESLPTGVLGEAMEESRRCDLFLAVGSSLVVQPAASLPLLARREGARLIIVNKDPTPLDDAADMVFHDRASEVLGHLV